jgi:hypothetical protein
MQSAHGIVANTFMTGEIKMSKSLFEELGGTYRLENGYRIPNLTLPDDGLGEEVYIGIWGMRRLDYLKKHKRVLYGQLLMSGSLQAHLYEIDTTAFERWERMIEHMKQAEGVTEDLKARDSMEWVRRVNGIRNRIEEVIRAELIYD